MGVLNNIFGAGRKATKIANRALGAIDSKNYSIAASAVAEIWRLREIEMGTGSIPSSSSFLDTVDELVSRIVNRAKGKIYGVNDTNDFYQWMKARVVASAREQATSRQSSIEKEARTFVNSTGMDALPITMFGPQAAGKNCPEKVQTAIFTLLDEYPPELAAMIVVRRFPPPLAGTFMFTFREMNAVRREYFSKAADVLACALCWMRDLAIAQHNLAQIPDSLIRSAIKDKLNMQATDIGWLNAAKLFS